MDVTTLTNYTFSLLTLTFLEIVLGIDNLVFISIISNRLPKPQQKLARRFGLLLAMVTRLMLLFAAVWLTKLTNPLFAIAGHPFSYRDLFLLFGGLFLIVKGTKEIHVEVTHEEHTTKPPKVNSFYFSVLQIGILDIVFSFDSVVTAVAMTQEFWIMASAIVIAIMVMLFLSEWISQFIDEHPTVKMLALSFLIMVGSILVADGFSMHMPRGYLYFAITFSLSVEALNLLVKRKRPLKQN